MFGVQEQFVQLAHLVDRDPLRAPQKIVEVLECVLCPVTDVVETENPPGGSVDDAFLESPAPGAAGRGDPE